MPEKVRFYAEFSRFEFRIFLQHQLLYQGWIVPSTLIITDRLKMKLGFILFPRVLAQYEMQIDGEKSIRYSSFLFSWLCNRICFSLCLFVNSCLYWWLERFLLGMCQAGEDNSVYKWWSYPFDHWHWCNWRDDRCAGVAIKCSTNHFRLGSLNTILRFLGTRIKNYYYIL